MKLQESALKIEDDAAEEELEEDPPPLSPTVPPRYGCPPPA
jgi:hypothetical protein